MSSSVDLHRYQEWLDFHFGRTDDDTDPFGMDWAFPGVGAELIVLFTRTMRRAGTDLAGFTDRQVAIGLQSLLFSGFGDFAYRLPTLAVDVDAKIAAVRSLRRLYSDCLSRRSPPVLGHLSETQGSPLEYVTYMLWDSSPLTVFASRAGTRPALLRVLEDALYLPNPACVESALHGLGHLRSTGVRGAAKRNAEPADIIDRFLAAPGEIDPSLRSYALEARTGYIL